MVNEKAPLVCAAGLALATACASGPHPSPDVVPRQSGPTVRRIDATSDLEDPIEAGKFDGTLSRKVYQVALEDCAEPIAMACEKWAKENSLPMLRREVGTGRVQVHFRAVGEPDGFFEVLYRADPDKRHAAVSFTFFRADGQFQEPSDRLPTAEQLAGDLPKLILCTSTKP
jgi:hypothetical protein